MPSARPLAMLVLAGLVVADAAAADAADAAAATGSPAPRIARFAGDRAAAASFTFDDGPLAHYADIAPVFDRHGFKATFFVIVGSIPDERPSGAAKPQASWAEWRDAAARGHEIGNHSWSHGDLRQVKDDAALRREIVESRDRIAERVGVMPRSFAYPFCKRDGRVEAMTLGSHIVARGYHPLYQGVFPPEKAQAWIDEAIAKRGWHVYLSHGVDTASLDAHLAWLKTVSDRVWVDTYGRVGGYAATRDRAVLTVVERGAGALACTLTLPEGADPQRFDAPLTLIVPVEGTPTAAQARRDGGAELPVTVASGRLLVDAAPGPGAIRISWR